MSEYRRTPQEVEELRDKVDEGGPSKYPGMTYEQGIAETIDWIFGHQDEAPSIEKKG